jgi:hypothetical protein
MGMGFLTPAVQVAFNKDKEQEAKILEKMIRATSSSLQNSKYSDLVLDADGKTLRARVIKEGRTDADEIGDIMITFHQVTCGDLTIVAQ